MPTVHKSYWIEAELAEAVSAYADSHGMKPSAAACVILRAGLDAMTMPTEEVSQASESASEAVSEENRPDAQQDDSRAVVELLRASNIDLRNHVSTLTKQLETTSGQLTAALEQNAGLLLVTGQAQALQAAEASRASEQTELATVSRLTWRERLARWIQGR